MTSCSPPLALSSLVTLWVLSSAETASAPRLLIQMAAVVPPLQCVPGSHCSNFFRIQVTQRQAARSIGHHAARSFLDLSAAFDTADHLFFIETLLVLTLSPWRPFSFSGPRASGHPLLHLRPFLLRYLVFNWISLWLSPIPFSFLTPIIWSTDTPLYLYLLYLKLFVRAFSHRPKGKSIYCNKLIQWVFPWKHTSVC